MFFAYVLFCSFILVFLATAFVTILGVAGKLPVQEKYLTKLVWSLLAEVAFACAVQFKTLDLTSQPQQLEKEITAAEIPLKTPGAIVTPMEKLHQLMAVYKTHVATESDLATCKAQLDKERKPLAIVGKIQGVDQIKLINANVQPSAYRTFPPLQLYGDGKIDQSLPDVEQLWLTVAATGYKPISQEDPVYQEALDVENAKEMPRRREINVGDVKFTKIESGPATLANPPKPAPSSQPTPLQQFYAPAPGPDSAKPSAQSSPNS